VHVQEFCWSHVLQIFLSLQIEFSQEWSVTVIFNYFSFNFFVLEFPSSGDRSPLCCSWKSSGCPQEINKGHPLRIGPALFQRERKASRGTCSERRPLRLILNNFNKGSTFFWTENKTVGLLSQLAEDDPTFVDYVNLLCGESKSGNAAYKEKSLTALAEISESLSSDRRILVLDAYIDVLRNSRAVGSWEKLRHIGRVH